MSSINHLAQEMIFKILTLLPVLSLLRCKAVCKLWKSIISDPHFIQAHFTISRNKQPPFSVLRYVPSGASEGLYIDTRGEDSVKLTLPACFSGMRFRVRSYNGLVTLADIHVGLFYIWNPLTRLFKMLPQSKLGLHLSGVRLFVTNLGFGFDSVSKDYKILRVRVGRYLCDGNEVSVTVAEVYSVNAGSWKEFRVPEEMQRFANFPFSKCVFVDSGVWYIEGYKEIMSFDLHDEVFGLYPYPKTGGRMSEILDFDGSVAVIRSVGGRASFLSLWKLDGVGENFSWTKMFNIEPDLKIDFILLYLGERQFFVEDYDAGCFFYDDRKKGDKKLPPLAGAISGCTSAFQFTGSLVSLQGFARFE
ncbi:putative F-box protein At4g09190 [Apium graveolens]|uniref:putative F-box protein At4g09190 n=1 Tax=Apium graveolens TaxID=4045 RepID=UPI003D7BB93E